jgi:hypothetical protein
VSRWEFSRGAGQTVKDIEGDNDGTLGGSDSYGSNDPTWERNCRVDGCMVFDGDDDTVNVGGGKGGIPQNNPLAVTAWWWIDSEHPSNQEANVIGNYNGGSNGWIYRIRPGDDDEFELWFNNNGHSSKGGGVPERDQWVHVGVSLNESYVTFYKDGRIFDVVSASESINGHTNSFRLASRGDSDTRNDLDGKLDDVRIYNTSLTGDEVRSAMTSPKQPLASWQSRGGQDLKPTHQWTLDAGKGQYAYDNAGDVKGTLGGSTGSEASDPKWTNDCLQRGCLSFDGADDLVDTGLKTADVEGPTGVTYAAWGKGKISPGWDVWLGSRAGCDFQIGDKDGTGNAAILYNTGGNYRVTSSVNVSDGNWHHIAGTWDKEKMELYVDGELINSNTAGSGSLCSDDLIGIGGEPTRKIRYWDGKIDDVRIYNHSLSVSSVKALYEAPSNSWSSSSLQLRTSAFESSHPDLLGSWSFEGVGQTVVDSSQYDNHGILGTNANRESGDPSRKQGYSGKALELDQDDKVQMRRGYYVNDHTLSFWIKQETVLESEYNLIFGNGAGGTDDDGTGGRLPYVYFNNPGEGGLHWRWSSDTDGNDGLNTPAGTVTRGTWIHLVGIKKGDKYSIYKNGKQIDSTTLADDGAGNDTSYVRLRQDARNEVTFSLDEIKFYNDSISEQKVKDLYRISDFSETSRFNQGSFLSPGRNKIKTVDSFEDGDIGEYGGETGSFSVSSSQPVWKGEESLKSTTNNRNIISNSGLSDYPERGDTFEYWIHGGGDTNSGGGLIFGRSDSNNYIKASIIPGNDEFRIWKRDDGSGIEVASRSLTLANNRWYRGVIEWKEDGSVIFSVHDSTKTKVAEIEAPPQKYRKGGVGWTTADSNGAPDLTFDSFKIKREGFDPQYLQYKVNMLTGDSSSVPSVEKVSVAQASGWTGFSSDDNGSGLNLPKSRFGQVQLKLSSDNPENSPTVDEVSLQSEPEGTDWLCSAPETGDWVIDRNCTFTGEQHAPGNVKVPSPHKLNITSDGLLGINLREFRLLIESKAKVLIDKLGSVQRVSFPEDCREVLEKNPSASSGTYKVDPDGEGGGKPFEVYCDMETDGGGWTIVASYTGADGEQPLVSDTEVSGNPLSFEHYNINRRKKMAISSTSSESLLLDDTGEWIKADHEMFDQNLNNNDEHKHYSVTLTSKDGSTASAVMGYSNYRIPRGGDYGIVTRSHGFDHHNNDYYHLNGGCDPGYLYSYSASDSDGDAGYDITTDLGGWTQTNGCESNEGGSLVFYAAMR